MGPVRYCTFSSDHFLCKNCSSIPGSRFITRCTHGTRVLASTSTPISSRASVTTGGPDSKVSPRVIVMLFSEDTPLPDGWDMRYSDDQKRWYFVDHTTKTTTWQDPRRRDTAVSNLRSKLLEQQGSFDSQALPGIFRIEVRRRHALRDTFELFRSCSRVELRSRPVVIFTGESPEETTAVKSDFVR